MPRKKRTIIDENIPDETETPNNSGIEDMVIVLTKVYKVNAAKRSFCFQTAEPVDEVIIQERYPAGGSFAVFEYNQSQEVVNSVTFDIEPKPIVNGPGVVSPQHDTNSLLMGELNWMRGMFMQMITNRSSEATPITEIIRAAKDIHSMSGGSAKDPVELILKGMELGQKSNGGSGDWKSELISTAREAVVPALQLLSGPKPNTNGVALMPQQTNQTTPQDIVKQAIVWLKSKILFGMEPGLAVDWILQNGNDPQYQPILAMAVQGTIDNFIELDSELANEPYRTWFTSAITMLKDHYAEQSGDPSDMDGGNRNPANNATHAQSGTGKPKLKKVV